MSKLTVKNSMVYEFLRRHLDNDDTATNVKAVYDANKDEIARRFGISTYATFNMHVRKCREWEVETGNKIEVIRLDNKEVLQNEHNT